MKERIYADTNIFIRFFADDMPEQTEISKKILKGLLEDKYELYLCDLVFAEIVYVLESYYKLDKKDILDKMFAILKFKNLVVENKSIIIEALEIYNEKNIDLLMLIWPVMPERPAAIKYFHLIKILPGSIF